MRWSSARPEKAASAWPIGNVAILSSTLHAALGPVRQRNDSNALRVRFAHAQILTVLNAMNTL